MQRPQLGKLGFLAAFAALTCGGAVAGPWWHCGQSPLFPVVPRRIWHANGTTRSLRRTLAEARPRGLGLSRRQSARTAGASTDQARVCLAAPPPALATLSVCVVDQSNPATAGP